MSNLRDVSTSVLCPDVWRAGTLVALDPGETTGIAWVGANHHLFVDQFRTSPLHFGLDLNELRRHLIRIGCTQVVYEDYRVYGWKTKDHAFAALHTPQLIGGIRYICHQETWPTTPQMASEAKAFWTDHKLKLYGLYDITKGKQHGRDALRHLLFFLTKLTQKAPLKGL